MEGFGAGRSLFSCCGDEDPFCLNLVLYPGEEARDSEPLTIHPLAVIEEPVLPEIVSSDWVVQKVKSLCHFVGLFCKGFGDGLMALFTTIEASRHQNGAASSPSSLSKLANRGRRELKRLACSINYDLKGGQRGKGKGRGSTSY